MSESTFQLLSIDVEDATLQVKMLAALYIQESMYQVSNNDDGAASLVDLFSTLDKADVTDLKGLHTDSFDTSVLTLVKMADIFAFVERWGVQVARLFMNSQEYQKLMANGLDNLETKVSRVMSGVFAHLRGAEVFVHRQVPPGTIYVWGDPGYVGRLVL